MPELGPYGSVRGARGDSRPYRESDSDIAKLARLIHLGPSKTCDAERITLQAHQPFRTDQTVPLHAQAVVAKDLAPSGGPLRKTFSNRPF